MLLIEISSQLFYRLPATVVSVTPCVSKKQQERGQTHERGDDEREILDVILTDHYSSPDSEDSLLSVQCSLHQLWEPPPPSASLTQFVCSSAQQTFIYWTDMCDHAICNPSKCYLQKLLLLPLQGLTAGNIHCVGWVIACFLPGFKVLRRLPWFSLTYNNKGLLSFIMWVPDSLSSSRWQWKV